MTTTTYTITRHNGLDVAAAIRAATEDSRHVRVNGRTVWAKYAAPAASTWQNGSVSVNVRGTRPGAQGTVWAKVGQTLTVETGAQA